MIPQDPQQKLLAALYLLARRVKREGLLSIEGDAFAPADSPLFKWLEIALSPGLELVADALRLIVSYAPNEPDLAFYLDTIRRHNELTAEDQSLLDLASVFLRAQARELPPQACAEFARQTLPFKDRPDGEALQSDLRALEREFTNSCEQHEGDMGSRITALFAKLQ